MSFLLSSRFSLAVSSYCPYYRVILAYRSGFFSVVASDLVWDVWKRARLALQVGNQDLVEIMRLAVETRRPM